MSQLISDDLQATMNRVALLGELAKAIAKERDLGRAVMARELPRGCTLTVLDPRDGTTVIGKVGMTDPKPEARVTDEAAFEAHIRAEHPGQVLMAPVFGDPAEVAAVLAEHAPHLLSTRTVIPEDLRERVLEAAVVQPVPGTTVVAAPSTPWARPNAAAKAIVAEALASAPVLAIGAGQ